MTDAMPNIRFAAALYPGGRMCLLCGSVTAGAVFPPVGDPPNKWSWRVWLTANGHAKTGIAKSELDAKNAALSVFQDFTYATGLVVPTT